jgi:hypothetical protein
MTIRIYLCCKAKVSNLQLHVFIEGKIIQFQLSVNELVFVEMLYTKKKLVHEKASFRFCDGFSSFVQLHETLKK